MDSLKDPIIFIKGNLEITKLMVMAFNVLINSNMWVNSKMEKEMVKEL